jgi:arylsulfatase A-like enzyme
LKPNPSLRPLLLAGFAIAATLLAGCGRSESKGPASAAALPPLPERPNLLLVTVDTLRADHLSSWGYARETSPAIDRLAAAGVRFDQAQVQWPKTGPSFASMHTATYGKDNDIVRQIGIPLPCSFRLLAEELSALGYRTGAVVANGAVGKEFFFDQGFEEYLETWQLVEAGAAPDSDPNRAERVTDLALGLLDRFQGEKPFFVWVHYLDPHAPYVPPAGHEDTFQRDEHYDPSRAVPIDRTKAKKEMTGIGRTQTLEGPEEVAFYVARYDAEIRYTDEQIGRLLGRIEERGLASRTATFFTADHGESLGEHDYWFAHGRFGFQTCLRVPLAAAWPGVFPARVDAEPVELIHLAPTLLELAGKPLEGGRWMQGRSLLGRLRGTESAEGTLAYSEAGYQKKGAWVRIVRDRRFKLMYAPSKPDQRWIGGLGNSFTLYDLVEDPGETRDVSAQFPAETERLKRELWKWDRAEPFSVEVDADTGDCAEHRAMDAETEKLLRSLGYL